MTDELLRIGELSRRVGVPAGSLRAWERRYGLLAPRRTQGGFRLYGPEDVTRVLTMRAGLDRGLSAAEAARLALAGAEENRATPVRVERGQELAAALEGFDEAAAQAALDALLAGLSVEAVMRDVLVPYLHTLGERWERGEVSVAQEHFASNVIRGRLAALARGWGRGSGPLALLACVEREEHDLPLLCFGLVLRGFGWRIAYLGTDTPADPLLQAARELSPTAVVVSGTTAGAFDGLGADLRAIAEVAPLYLAGPSAGDQEAAVARATHLDGDIFAAAASLSSSRP